MANKTDFQVVDISMKITDKISDDRKYSCR